MLEQALFLLRQVDARFELTGALFLYDDRARAHGDLKRAEALYQETIAIARELGSRVSIADWLVYLGTLELYRGNYNAAEKYLEETLVLFRDLDNQIGIAHVTYCLADLALHQGDYNRAAKMVNDSLLKAPSFLSNVSNREFSIERLLIVGKLACADGDYEEAAMLFGAAEALRKQWGYLLEPLLQGEYTEAVARVRVQLDPALLETAWAEGQAMTEEETITSALGYLQAEFDVMG